MKAKDGVILHIKLYTLLVFLIVFGNIAVFL